MKPPRLMSIFTDFEDIIKDLKVNFSISDKTFILPISILLHTAYIFVLSS